VFRNVDCLLIYQKHDKRDYTEYRDISLILCALKILPSSWCVSDGICFVCKL
jgi:hypothetical protein